MARPKMLTVKVSGLKELEQALNALDHDLHKKALKTAGKEAMRPVYTRVLNNVVVGETGGLKSTIKLTSTSDVRTLRKISKKAAMVARVSAGTTKRRDGLTGHQALRIEYGLHGKRKMAAQPFMRPAIQGKEKVVFMHFRRLLGVHIEKTARTQMKRNRRNAKKI